MKKSTDTSNDSLANMSRTYNDGWRSGALDTIGWMLVLSENSPKYERLRAEAERRFGYATIADELRRRGRG